MAGSSFLSFGFALAKELNKLPFSFFAGGIFSFVFADEAEFWRCRGLGGSSFLISAFPGCKGSDWAGLFAGTVLEGGGGGRTPVLLCSTSSQQDKAYMIVFYM